MPSMTLRVLLPFEIFSDETDVASIVVETAQGSYGLLPRRLDCVAALVPGILSYESASQGEVFVAVDEGVLVKTGLAVVISVRRALRRREIPGRAPVCGPAHHAYIDGRKSTTRG